MIVTDLKLDDYDDDDDDECKKLDCFLMWLRMYVLLLFCFSEKAPQEIYDYYYNYNCYFFLSFFLIFIFVFISLFFIHLFIYLFVRNNYVDGKVDPIGLLPPTCQKSF